MNPVTELPSALNLPRVLFAAGSLSALAGELEALGVHKPLLVTDQGLVGAGLAAKAIAACGKTALAVFDNVTENPLFSDVDKGAAWYAQQGCDGVVALGGGSVIDTAKMIALLATNPGSVANYAGVRNAPHGPSAPLIVIPTTAGTGSEASPSAGIHPDALSPSVGMGSLMRELGLPATLAELNYVPRDLQALAHAAHQSHFNLFAPFHPTASDYAAMLAGSLKKNP